MNRTLLLLVFAAFAALFAARASAAANVSHSDGSRWDVRGWCIVHGGIIEEAADATTCISVNAPGVAFSCDDAGACTRAGFDLIATGGITPASGETAAPAASTPPSPGLGDIVPNDHYLPHHYP